MDETERYLRGATRGLWGKEKKALRTELQGHIRIRTKELMVAGFSEAEAERQTLRELGAPGEVSRGMAGVYALQTVVKGAVLSSLLACAGLLTLQQAQAQVQGWFGSTPTTSGAAYLNVAQLNQELSRVGGSLSLAPVNAANGDLGRLNLPGSPLHSSSLQFWPGAVVRQDGQEYLHTLPFLLAMQNLGVPLKISGWKNPTLSAGNVKIEIQTDDWRVLSDLYTRTLPATARGPMWHIPMRNLEPDGTTDEATIRHSGLKAGHIYALVLPVFGQWWTQDLNGNRIEGQSGALNLAVNVLQAQQDGSATFRVYTMTKPFKLVGSEAQFQKMVAPYEHKLSYWTEDDPAPGLLLEMTGKFGPDAYKVLPPSAWK